MNSLELPTEEEEEYFANLESYSDDEPSSSKKPRKLKSYPVQFKVKVIDHAKSNSNNSAAKTYKEHVNRRRAAKASSRWRPTAQIQGCRRSTRCLGSIGNQPRRMPIAQTGPKQSSHSLQRRGRRKRLHRQPWMAGSVHVTTPLFRTIQNYCVSESTSRVRGEASQLRDVCLEAEDDMIHCFKPHGPVPGGRELLRKAREDSAEVEPLIMEEDPEENKENGATDSEQELVIEE
ncbi:hypothetical protein DdX_02654 [Ditylenchus destructor]|uniref:Uncharacterized protein n=1 Tax=Ditylenchus destructor TaxID=166010 RepID=A0AAD4NI03_9BILA|nr:hypothetical protein DdX_02654 [Ditylenchus destructor]